MSAEVDFRAMLRANSGVVALVGADGIGMHEVPNQAPPYIVFTATHETQQTLRGPDEDQTAFQVGCWGLNALSAIALADAVVSAIEAYDAASTTVSATVLSRQAVFDEETGLDGVLMSVEWWP